MKWVLRIAGLGLLVGAGTALMFGVVAAGEDRLLRAVLLTLIGISTLSGAVELLRPDLSRP